MLVEKPNWFVRTALSGLVWKVETEKKIIYLTFDDGPIPEVTPWVLTQLKKYSAKATFFCVGDNVKRYPEIFQAILEDGHAVGNHTFNHITGTSHDLEPYLENIAEAQELIHSKFFRPPHGLMTPKQMNRLKRDYRIVMWDVLSCDYDAKLTPEDCLKTTIKNCSEGSIVVFHDSLKAEARLRYALPRFIEHFLSLDYKFDALVEEVL
jgi:peptidoglycan/xylan/chitin deacetylase (PgdA/CDA1 family)